MRSTGEPRNPLLMGDVHLNRPDPEVERLQERIGELIRERQELRTSGASRGTLEDNRRRLLQRQTELGYALIARHAPAFAT
jgi:hypothetical protein